MSASTTERAVGILCTHDLMFYSQVTGTARLRGKNMIGVSSLDDLLVRMAEAPVTCLFLDLMLPMLDIERDIPRIRDTGSAETIIVAYGPHVQVDRLERAQTAGCDQVMPRSRFSSTLNELIDNHVPDRVES